MQANATYEAVPVMQPPEWLCGAQRNVYSQSGEDGLLQAIGQQIGWDTNPAERWCCEVGAGDGVFCSNTRLLIEQGWNAVLIERDPGRHQQLMELYKDNDRVFVVQADVVEEGLDKLLDLAGAPPTPDLVVIDVDGPDYYVWNAMMEHRPTVVMCEYGKGAVEELPTLEQCKASRDHAIVQAGRMSIQRLACAKLYTPICITGYNVICAANETAIARETRATVQHPATDARTELRLNLGSGDQGLPGYVNLDIKRGQPAHPLTQFADESVDEIRASHVLEHFSHRDVATVLKEWARVLRPGGILKVAVPNFKTIVDWYRGGRNDLPLQSYILGGHTDEHDVHHCLFEPALLESLMRQSGLINIRPWQSEVGDCAALPVSLNLMGEKPGGDCPPAEDISQEVVCVCTLPRLMFTDGVHALLDGIRSLNIRIEMVQGAFWGHCMHIGMERYIEESPYILTWDYDTLFDRWDVIALWRLMHRHPEVGAIAGLQMKRESSKVGLMNLLSKDGKKTVSVSVDEFSAELLPVRTAHFGLTILRSSALKATPKPWFVDTPDANGGWGEGSIDDDIGFWEAFCAAGNTVAIAPRVLLGHIQLGVTWPGRNMTDYWQTMTDYRANGRPRQAGVL